MKEKVKKFEKDFSKYLNDEVEMFRKKRTSKEWLKRQKNIIILDPDGWDRQNYDYSFNREKITKQEFQKRLVISTCIMKHKI